MMERAKVKSFNVVCAALAAVVFSAASARAFDKGDVKDSTEVLCNWLIDQYDSSEKVFGKGPEAKELKQVALVLAALSDSPNDYKETNAPFISDPVKYLVNGLREEIKKGANANEEALKWGGIALISLNNKKYNDLSEAIGKTQPMIKVDVKAVLKDAADALNAVVVEREYLNKTFQTLLLASKSSTDGEFESDGKKVAWAAGMAERLVKLQKEDGSFGPDVRANAMVLQILDLCYKSMK